MTQDTIPPLEGVEDPGSMTLTEIYNMLLLSNEIILTIPAEEEKKLRTGLASVKAKSNKKLQDEGMPADKSVISYSSTPAKDKEGNPTVGAVDLLITLGSRSAITVLDVKLPDNSI